MEQTLLTERPTTQRKVVAIVALVGLAAVVTIGVVNQGVRTPVPVATTLNDNSCVWNHDGECDDDGACQTGTDCSDCSNCGGGGSCTNTCSFHDDGECDDGGPNHITSLCQFGTDCNDCGSRTVQNADDSCMWSNDQECDVTSGLCPPGTDCSDCGNCGSDPCVGCTSSHLSNGEVCYLANDHTCSTPDNTYYCSDENGNSRVSTCGYGSSGCSNTCAFHNDGECDDGGSGHLTSLCDLGSDCDDCGARSGIGDPCATCSSSHLGYGQHCFLAPDGTCSTPDNRYYCRNSYGTLRVQSCNAVTLASEPTVLAAAAHADEKKEQQPKAARFAQIATKKARTKAARRARRQAAEQQKRARRAQ